MVRCCQRCLGLVLESLRLAGRDELVILPRRGPRESVSDCDSLITWVACTVLSRRVFNFERRHPKKSCVTVVCQARAGFGRRSPLSFVLMGAWPFQWLRSQGA